MINVYLRRLPGNGFKKYRCGFFANWAPADLPTDSNRHNEVEINQECWGIKLQLFQLEPCPPKSPPMAPVPVESWAVTTSVPGESKTMAAAV